MTFNFKLCISASSGLQLPLIVLMYNAGVNVLSYIPLLQESNLVECNLWAQFFNDFQTQLVKKNPENKD